MPAHMQARLGASRQNNQFRLVAATHSFDCPGSERTRIVLVATGSDCFRRYLLLAASHDWAVWLKRRVGTERDHESIVLVRTHPHYVSPSLYAEQLVVFGVGNTGFYVSGVGVPSDINRARR